MSKGVLSYAREGEAPRTFTVLPGATSIGSAPQNDLVLSAPGVDAFHARILSTVEDLWIIDHNSELGTFLNQVRLRPNARYRLRNGDTVRIGPFFLRYLATEQTEQDDLSMLVDGLLGDANTKRSHTQVLPPEIAARLANLGVAGMRGSARMPVVRLPQPDQGLRKLAAFRDMHRSYLMQYLPPCFQNNEFLEQFLMLFEAVLLPIENVVDFIHYYFDPELAPKELLPWLATWVNLALNEQWPIERRRTLIKSAAHLYTYRGTREGLSTYLQIYTGIQPQISEPALDEAGTGTTLPPHTFKVLLEVPDLAAVDRQLVEAIIQSEKPAHTAYTLEIRAARPAA